MIIKTTWKIQTIDVEIHIVISEETIIKKVKIDIIKQTNESNRNKTNSVIINPKIAYIIPLINLRSL